MTTKWDYTTRKLQSEAQLSDTLEYCGEEGWELVQMFRAEPDQPLLIFKRPKSK